MNRIGAFISTITKVKYANVPDKIRSQEAQTTDKGKWTSVCVPYLISYNAGEGASSMHLTQGNEFHRVGSVRIEKLLLLYSIIPISMR